jgi:hypothetical protein
VSDHREDHFLVDWVEDPHARHVLLDNGVILVDNFREAIADRRAVEHARSVVPTAYEEAVDETVAVRLYAAAAALMARLSCSRAAACIAEEMLAAHLVIQCAGDLEHTPRWEHLTDGERLRAIRALDGVFDLFQDDEALGLFGAAAAEHTTPEQAIAEVRTWFRPFNGVHVTGHLDEHRLGYEGRLDHDQREEGPT